MNILQTIKEKQKTLKITNISMAEQMGISKVTYWKILTGEQALRQSDLQTICKILGVQMDITLTENNDELILTDL